MPMLEKYKQKTRSMLVLKTTKKVIAPLQLSLRPTSPKWTNQHSIRQRAPRNGPAETPPDVQAKQAEEPAVRKRERDSEGDLSKAYSVERGMKMKKKPMRKNQV